MNSLDPELLLLIINNLYPSDAFRLKGVNKRFNNLFNTQLFQLNYKWYELGISLKCFWINHYLPYKIIKSGNKLFLRSQHKSLFTNIHRISDDFKKILMKLVITNNCMALCTKYMNKYNISPDWYQVDLAINSGHNYMVLYFLTKLVDNKEYNSKISNCVSIAIKNHNYELILSLITICSDITVDILYTYLHGTESIIELVENNCKLDKTSLSSNLVKLLHLKNYRLLERFVNKYNDIFEIICNGNYYVRSDNIRQSIILTFDPNIYDIFISRGYNLYSKEVKDNILSGNKRKYNLIQMKVLIEYFGRYIDLKQMCNKHLHNPEVAMYILQQIDPKECNEETRQLYLTYLRHLTKK